MRGTLTTVLEAQCQRCLGWLTLPLSTTLDVLARAAGGTVRDDEADMVELHDGWLDVHKLVEDEILLNLPLVPAHASDGCARAQPETASQAKRRPFAELGSLIATASAPAHRERN